MANFILANGAIAKSSLGRHEVFFLWGEVMCMAEGKGSVFMKITLAGKREGRRPKLCVLNIFPSQKYFSVFLKGGVFD